MLQSCTYAVDKEKALATLLLLRPSRIATPPQREVMK